MQRLRDADGPRRHRNLHGGRDSAVVIPRPLRRSRRILGEFCTRVVSQRQDVDHETLAAAISRVPRLVGDRTVVAASLINGVSVRVTGFIIAVVVFSVAQALLSPFIAKMATRHASALLGGIGLVSTLLALVLASVFTHGLTIRGIGSWVAATVVVWLVSALATMLLPMLLIKKKVG
jgi:uncharacterized membrane protein YvlD (DUF360 family)